MASDKKSDDFAIRMPDRNDAFQEEKDPFLARAPSHNRLAAHPPAFAARIAEFQNSPGFSILAYCFSSISMTVVNKYCVSGKDWNLNLFYLAIQVRNVGNARRVTMHQWRERVHRRLTTRLTCSLSFV